MKIKQIERPLSRSQQLSPITRAVRTALFCSSVIAVSSAQIAVPVFAQEPTQNEQESGAVDRDRRGNIDLEEIIVTATRRDSTVFEVPYAISVLSGSQMERSGVQDLSDLTRVIPGIGYLEQGPRVANNNNYIILRGLNATSQSGAADTPFLAEPVVSTYFGNTPIFANFQTADLARVEVLRGPQGTLYGSGSLGGTIRFIPNEPSTDASTFEVSAELSSTDHSGETSYNLSAVINQPISDNTALRFVAGYRQLGGFIDYDGWVEPDANGYPIPDGPNSWETKPRQKDANDSTDWFFRAMASVEVSDKTDILFTWQHQSLDVDNRQSHSLEFASAGVDDPYVQLIPYEEPLESDMDLLAMDIEVDLGFATLSSSTSYTTSEAEWARDATGLYQTAFYWYTNYYYPYATVISVGTSEQDVIAQEFRLVSSSDSALEWVAGLYYVKQDFSVDEVQTMPGLMDYIANDPFTFAVVVPPSDVTYPAERDWTFEDMAVFGELTYHINDSWQVTGGVRVFEQSFDQLFVFHAPFCPSFYYAPAVCGDPGGDGVTTTTMLEDNISDQIFKFNTSVNLGENSKAYFTWSDGFRHGGANAVPTQGPWPEAPGVYGAYVPDVATNVEIGFKGSTANGKMSYTLAAFRIDWDQTQFDTFTETYSYSAVVNGTDAVATGLELELAGALTENWTYNLGINYTESEWDKDGFVGSSPISKGAQLPGVAKEMGTFSTDYYWSVNMGDAYVHLDAFYRGSSETSPNVSWGNYEKLDSFSIVNVSIGLQTEKWDARLFVDNISDELGVTGGQLESGYLNYAYHFVQRPRTAGVQLRYIFK